MIHSGCCRLIAFPTVFLLIGTRAGAQGCSDSLIVDRLRSAVEATSAETIRVSRDYLPSMPGVSFYRTSRREPGSFHVPERKAAVVVTGRDTVVVRDIQDLVRVWSAIEGQRSAGSPFSSLFMQLLVQTGLLPSSPRILNSERDLPAGYRAFLSNRANLAKIRPPLDRSDSSGSETAFFVASSVGVVYYRALLTRDGHFIPSMEVISRFEDS